MVKRLIPIIILLLLVLFILISLIIYYANKAHNADSADSAKICQNFLAAKFSNIEDVKKSHQYKYLSCLYTDDQLQSKLPFSMSDFWVIQTNLLPADVTVDKVPKSPTGYHTLFTHLDSHVASEKSVVYNYQYNSLPSTWANSPPDLNFKLKDGLADNSWVEVQRGKDATGGYTWFYYMPGTGNWFNLGKTIVFADHHEAFKVAAENGVKFQNPINGLHSDQTLLGDYFKKKNYDTIQFTQRAENIYKYEIFNLKNKQTDSKEVACIPGVKTRGNLECDCSTDLLYLNCMTNGPCGKIALPNI
jgi:hypothetical protein